MQLTSMDWSFLSYTFHVAEFINFDFTWDILFFLSIVMESFAEYSSLAWNLCSLLEIVAHICSPSDFIVSTKKSNEIPIGLFLCYLAFYSFSF